MRLRRSMSCIACGLPLLTLAGCYSPQPYGSTGYPGYYSQPGGGMVGPQGGPQLGPPTLVNPNGGVPGGVPSGGWQSPVQPGQSDAPTFEQNNSGKVPNADALDLPKIDRFEAPRQSPEDVPAFDEGQTPLRTPDSGASLQRDGRERADLSFDGNGLDFEPPLEVTPASSTKSIAQLSSAEGSSGPNPFSFDREQYRFLQGVVEYDARDKTWHVMYSAEPDGSDKFGGDISLLDHPGLKGLRDKDVVYVEGHIDPQARDSNGKPRYRIDHMRKLVPKRA